MVHGSKCLVTLFSDAQECGLTRFLLSRESISALGKHSIKLTGTKLKYHNVNQQASEWISALGKHSIKRMD